MIKREYISYLEIVISIPIILYSGYRLTFFSINPHLDRHGWGAMSFSIFIFLSAILLFAGIMLKKNLKLGIIVHLVFVIIVCLFWVGRTTIGFFLNIFLKLFRDIAVKNNNVEVTQ